MDNSVKMMVGVIQQSWDNFEKDVVPEGADLTQRSEMRGAFVSGMMVGVDKYSTMHMLSQPNFAEAVYRETLKYLDGQAIEVYAKAKE